MLENQTFEESIKCTLPQTVEDDVNGCKSHHNLNSSCIDVNDLTVGVANIPGQSMTD